MFLFVLFYRVSNEFLCFLTVFDDVFSSNVLFNNGLEDISDYDSCASMIVHCSPMVLSSF